MKKPEMIKLGATLGISFEGLSNNPEREKALKEELSKRLEGFKVETSGNESLNTLLDLYRDNDPEQVSDELLAKAKTLEIDTEGLDTNAKLQAAIDEKEPKVQSASTPAPEQKSAKVKTYTDPRGVEWSFKPNAPKTINIDGHPMTQDEILEDEAIIAELATGNNSFLTRKY